MSAARLAFILGLLTATAPAAAESTAGAMQAFGLVGIWSTDCSIDMAQRCTNVTNCMPRVIFAVPLFGAPTREFVYPPFPPGLGQPKFTTTSIDSAIRITEDKLKIVYHVTTSITGLASYVLPVNGELWETVYEKAGNKIHIWSSRRADGGKIGAENGFMTAPGENWKPEDGPVKVWRQTERMAPVLERCVN